MVLAALLSGPHWGDIVVMAMLVVIALLLVGFVLNLNKLLVRVSSIRRVIRESAESGVGAQLVEAVAQLQSVAVSLDRIALRCDEMERKLDEIVQRGPGGQSSVLEEVSSGMRDGLKDLQEPLAQIRDAVQRSRRERLGDEIRRVLFNQGYDRVETLTDIANLPDAESKVHVEVRREGVKAKGFVVVKDGTVVELKISPPFDMFP
jgi:hypothetical protein